MKTANRQFRLFDAGKPKSVYPIVGVVTPVRNRKNWTLGFVESFARQDYPVFTHYIVDSASTDGTPEAIAALGLRSVTLMAAPDSAYWTAATNIGVCQALKDGCEFILTINDDAIIAEDFLSRLVEATQAHDLKLVGSLIAYADRPNVIWGVGAYNNFESGHFVQTGFDNVPEDDFNLEIPREAQLIAVENLCGNGTLVHRSVFDAIGLYDERNTPHYHADTELTMRARAAGIQSWVAREARVYNRFTEEQDGAFAKKNRRFFSLRSANYVRPIVHILRQNCPPELRARAFLGYFAPYFGAVTPRHRSKLVRMASLLAQDNWQKGAGRSLVPAVSDAEILRFDFDILRNLPHSVAADAVYAYLLLRLPSEAERKDRLRQLKRGISIDRIIIDVVKSVEFKMRQPELADIAPLIADPACLKPEILQSEDFTPAERVVLSRLLAERSGKDALRATWIAATELPKKVLQKAGLSLRGRKRGDAVTLRTDALRPASSQQKQITVFFNIDVFCMAQLDPKAATGVYRYASSVFEELLKRAELELRTFHSPELENGYELWTQAQPSRQAMALGRHEKASSNAVVFYPYFALRESDPRLAGCPVALTICDLFPLVRPEWFSEVAVSNFRRHLHVLPKVDHIFCISEATRQQLHENLPSLRASSSVAHLAATKPHFIPVRDPSNQPNRYFLSVGTIEPRKNLKTVIQAFARLKHDEIGDLQMLVAGQEGWSISPEELRAIAGDKADQVRFLGRLSDPDLHAFYRDAEFTVFVSLAEGFGLPIVESFLHGTPVITSNNSSMKEIAGNAAFLVDPTDEQNISEAIADLALHPERREFLAKMGRQRCMSFSWANCADVHVAAFTELTKIQNPITRE